MGQTTEAARADDEALARRARDGDVEAFGVLVTRYQGRLWRFLAGWVREHGDREELVQEVFMAAYRGIGRFRGEARFSTWLYQIAVNQARGHRRRLARRPRHVALPTAGGGDDGAADTSAGVGAARLAMADPQRAAERREVREAIWTLVERLPQEWQAVMRLRYAEELTHPEIAEVLGVPIGTVKAQLHRGRRRLAEWLVQEGIG